MIFLHWRDESVRENGAFHSDDVSVTGYDGITLSEVLRPKLTTYYQDAEAIGRESARRLVDVIENPKTRHTGENNGNRTLIEGKSVKQI